MRMLLKARYAPVIFVLLTLCYASNLNATVFSALNFEHIKQKNMGKRWLMLLWSVDCPPCFKELALIEQLRKSKPDLAVVLVNTDADEEIDNERNTIIERFHLSSVPQLNFVEGSADKSRYIIDSSWYGELPRSYFVEENGTFHGRSGLVSEEILKKWLIE